MLLAAPDRAIPMTPMYWRRDFPGTPDQARAVRRFLAHLLPGCAALDDVLLAVDELVVNAIRHTRSGGDGGYFGVEVHRDHAATAVGVVDQGGPTEPCALAPTPPTGSGDLETLEESGRGLLTVAALATHWSWTGDERGRVVRAVFAARE